MSSCERCHAQFTSGRRRPGRFCTKICAIKATAEKRSAQSRVASDARPNCPTCGGRPAAEMRNRFCSRRCWAQANPQSQRMPNEIVVDGDVAKIVLRHHDGSFAAHALIDVADIPLVTSRTWALHGGGVSGITRKRAARPLLHRVIMGVDGASRPAIDHINGDTLDNRRSNLRPCGNDSGMKKNGQNRTSPYSNKKHSDLPRGVRRCVRGDNVYFAVEHKLNYRNIHGGYFKSIAAADAAAQAWRAEHMPFSMEARGEVSP